MTANHEAKLTPTTARLLVEALKKGLLWTDEENDVAEWRGKANEALSAAERELEGK